MGLEAGVKYVQVSAGGHHTVLLRSDGQAIAVGAQGDISIPAVKQYQTWMDWAMTKPVLPDGVEYAPDCGELPVGSRKDELGKSSLPMQDSCTKSYGMLVAVSMFRCFNDFVEFCSHCVVSLHSVDTRVNIFSVNVHVPGRSPR